MCFWKTIYPETQVGQSSPIPKTRSHNLKYDLVVTSPPYGDSGTTVAYGQYTSFGSEWVNGIDIHRGAVDSYKIDPRMLRKKRAIKRRTGATMLS